MISLVGTLFSIVKGSMIPLVGYIVTGHSIMILQNVVADKRTKVKRHVQQIQRHHNNHSLPSYTKSFMTFKITCVIKILINQRHSIKTFKTKA